MQAHINIKIEIQKQIIHLKIKQECTIKQIIQYLHRQQLLHNTKNENDLIIKTINNNREQIIQLQQAVSTINPVDQQGTRNIKIVWREQFSYSRRIPTNQNVFQCYSEEFFKRVCFAIFNYSSNKHKVQQMYRENKITKKGYEMFSRIGKQHEQTGDQRLLHLKTQLKEKSQRIEKLQKELDAMNQIISFVRDRQRYNSTFQKLNQYLSPTSLKSIQLLKIIANKVKIKSNISGSSSNIKSHSGQKLFQSQFSFQSVMSINKQQEMNEMKEMNINEGEFNSKISSQLFKLPYFKLHQQKYVARLEKYINQFTFRYVTNIYSVYFHSSQTAMKDKSQNQLQKQLVSCMQATNNFIFLFGVNTKIFGIYSPTNCIKCSYSDMGFIFNLTDDKIFGIRSDQVLYNRKGNDLLIWNNLISINMRENTMQVNKNEDKWRNFSQDCQSPQNFSIDLGKKIQFRGFQYLTAHFSNS